MSNDGVARLVLGTAQLGMDYGIANFSGRPAADKADSILAVAHEAGIRRLDTAQAYGDSESVIGAFLAGRPDCAFEVFTKLDPGIDHGDANRIRIAVEESVRRIGRPLAGIMVHDAAQLEHWHGALGAALTGCVESGLVDAVGATVHTPDQFRTAIGIAGIEFIQAPFNALDRRLSETGLLARAGRRRLFLRSAFLQGLLLLEADRIPPHMAFARAPIGRWHDLCREHHVAAHQAALGVVRAIAPTALIVVGCETVEQLSANIAAMKAPPPDGEFLGALCGLPLGDDRLIDPARWPKAA